MRWPQFCIGGFFWLALCASAPAADIQAFAQQVLHSGNAGGRAFAVVDKPAGRIWVFDSQGRPVADGPALLGQAQGDRSPPDIGTRPLSRIRPHEKITAAGRYVTEPGRNLQNEDIVWLDYDMALSMHRVRQVPGERRPQRLQTAHTHDKRISFGCINLVPEFYEAHIDPLFARQSGVVYVLPETLALQQVFDFIAPSD